MEQIAQLVLQSAPFLIILILANMGQGHPIFRQLTVLFLGVINLFLIGGGVLTTLSALLIARGLMPPPSEATVFATSPLPGFMMLLTGILAVIPLLAPARHLIAKHIAIDPDNMVHTTALVFAAYLVGGTATQFLSGPPALEDVTITVGALWTQAFLFVIFGLIGVGLGLRRDGREALQRLGLEGLTRRQLGLIVVAVVGLLAFDIVVGLLWEALDPESFGALDESIGGLLEGLLSPIGILSLGLSAGLGEEILFRGALQPRFGPFWATLLFAAGHVQYAITPALLEIFVIGFVLALIRQRENTTTTIAIHALYNTIGVLIPVMLGV